MMRIPSSSTCGITYDRPWHSLLSAISLPLQEWVVKSLFAEGGVGAVAWHYGDAVAKWQ
jgi:hypothetical protein